MPAALFSEWPANLFIGRPVKHPGKIIPFVSRIIRHSQYHSAGNVFVVLLIMAKKKTGKQHKQFGGITDKRDNNAGSGAFNQGSQQDPDYKDGVPGDQNDPRKAVILNKKPKGGKTPV